MDGSDNYDSDGDPTISYSWSQTGGPQVILENPSSAHPQITISNDIPHNSKFTFQLKVADNKIDINSLSTVNIKLSCFVDVWVSTCLPLWMPNGRVQNPAPIHTITTNPEIHRTSHELLIIMSLLQIYEILLIKVDQQDNGLV